jgi:hypothetical protein
MPILVPPGHFEYGVPPAISILRLMPMGSVLCLPIGVFFFCVEFFINLKINTYCVYQ